MTHEDAGHYSTKHSAGSSPDPAIAAALASEADERRITCVGAFKAAEGLGVAPSEVGRTADLLEYRIVRCQLGLFGYAPDKKVVKPAGEVTGELRDRLDAAVADGVVDCASAFEIAETLGLPKITVSAACESLGIKIVDCQLGAF